MTGIYLLILTIVALVLVCGYDETLRIILYLDLQIRYIIVKFQMKFIGWKLKRQLVKDRTNFEQFIKECKE